MRSMGGDESRRSASAAIQPFNEHSGVGDFTAAHDVCSL